MDELDYGFLLQYAYQFHTADLLSNSFMKLPENQPQDKYSIICDQENPNTEGAIRIDLVTSQQIRGAIMTISKLKKISKATQSTLKKKYKSFNQLFGEMSSLFIHKKIKCKKQERRERAELRRRATLCKKDQQHKKLLRFIAYEQSEAHAQGKNQEKNQIVEEVQDEQEQLKDIKPHTCYICLKKYTQIDDMYHSHCPTCAALGKEKRFQTSNLSGMTALVTGARIKIGYQIALKLLRDGAMVYATTRFIKDALTRYQQQVDYEQFKDRLILIQCDLLSSEQVVSLIQYLKQKIQHLDILIHNAAQTITRPTSFYTFELANQNRQIEAGSNLVYFDNQSLPSLQIQSTKAIERIEGTETGKNQEVELKYTDQFGQPLDLRTKNTWREKIEQVSLYDCMSTQVINSTVPFYLTGQLRCKMGVSSPSWVVNVSSMEGVFYKPFKSCFHPHTNMAKASLNMMTRTCAQEMSIEKIYLNSVDTGWVTNENPLLIQAKMATKYGFTPPLDCIEGAMRVLDPIYQGVNQGNFIYGKFLKNYKQSVW